MHSNGARIGAGVPTNTQTAQTQQQLRTNITDRHAAETCPRSLVRVLHTPAKGTQTRTSNKITLLACLVSSTTSHSATVWFVWFGLVQCALFLLPSFIHAKSNLANKAVLYKTALHTWMEGWKSIQVLYASNVNKACSGVCCLVWSGAVRCGGGTRSETRKEARSVFES